MKCFQQVNLTWARHLVEKPAFGQRSTSKITWPRWVVHLSRRYGHVILSADTLFWQVSIAHNMDVQYQRSTRKTKAACLYQPIIWSMTAMLRYSTVAVVAVVRTRPRAIPLPMTTMRKSVHGFHFPYVVMGLRLAASAKNKTDLVSWKLGAILKIA